MKQGVLKFILFFINPFLGFLESFRNPERHTSRIIIYLWFVLFGFCFVPESESVENAGDATRYAADFRDAQMETSWSYMQDIIDYFKNNDTTETRDLYTLTLNYVVSRFTSNYHWLFMLFAIIFGFFYVKTMKFILPPKDASYQLFVFPILFLLFCFSNPIFNINGVRFWTATWIAVYLMFHILVKNEYTYLILAPITYFIHAGFIIFILVLLLFFLLKRFHGFWNIAFIISLFFTAASFVDVFDNYTYLLPANLQRFMMYYADEEVIAEKLQAQGTIPFYARVLRLLPRIIINVLVAVCLINRKKLSEEYHSGRVLEFIVVLMCVVNLTLSIPSVGVRFIKMAVPFIVYLFVVNSDLTKRFSSLVYFIPIAYSYEVLYWVRHMISISEWYLYVLPLPLSIIHYL